MMMKKRRRSSLLVELGGDEVVETIVEGLDPLG